MKSRTSQKRQGGSQARARQQLLATLRRQSKQLDHGFFRREQAPELHDLAEAAGAVQWRSVSFGGIRFPMKFGWWKYVLDPETGETLVAARGSFL